jgi:Domain of unknown function (DUF4760)
MTTYEWTTIVIQILGFGVLISQVAVAIKAIHADHERRKKQSSIEQLGSMYRECRHDLEARFGTAPLTNDDIAKIQDDQAYEASVVRLLGVLEHIAVGVNSGIYDEEIVFRMSATSMIDIFKRLELYIRYRQKHVNTACYIEFNYMIRKFENKKLIQPSSSGNIKRSKNA